MRNHFGVFLIGVVVLVLVCLGIVGQRLARMEQEAAVRAEEDARQAWEQRRQADRLRQAREQAGVGDPNGPEMLQDALKHDIDVPNSPLTSLKLEDLFEDDLLTHGDRKEQTRINEQLARGERGTPGSGGSTGRGFGGGYDNPNAKARKKPTARQLRQSRWIIILEREDPETLLKNLIKLKAMLAIPEGDSATHCNICEDLAKRPAEWKKVDQEGVKKYNRLWFLTHSRTDREYTESLFSLTSTPLWVAVFIPNDLEKLMAEEEFKTKKMYEDELNQRKWITVFEIDRRGDSWYVRVRYQGPRKP